jgi:hypothetical protein
MSFFIVDVEADGPIPGEYSMVSFGAVRLDPALATTFYGRTRPVSATFVPEALAVSGHSRAEHEAFDDPAEVMARFESWCAMPSRHPHGSSFAKPATPTIPSTTPAATPRPCSRWRQWG